MQVSWSITLAQRGLGVDAPEAGSMWSEYNRVSEECRRRPPGDTGRAGSHPPSSALGHRAIASRDEPDATPLPLRLPGLRGHDAGGGSCRRGRNRPGRHGSRAERQTARRRDPRRRANRPRTRSPGSPTPATPRVLNLRGGEESSIRGEEVERFGLEYFELPIEGAAGLTEESAREFARLLDELPRPTLVHCGSGNRVGGLFALEAHFVDGRSGAEALEIGLESGLTSLEGVVRERLGLTED